MRHAPHCYAIYKICKRRVIKPRGAGNSPLRSYLATIPAGFTRVQSRPNLTKGECSRRGAAVDGSAAASRRRAVIATVRAARTTGTDASRPLACELRLAGNGEGSEVGCIRPGAGGDV